MGGITGPSELIETVSSVVAERPLSVIGTKERNAILSALYVRAPLAPGSQADGVTFSESIHWP